MKNIINNELKVYIQNNIISEYDNFDKGHDRNHVYSVIERSFNIVKELKLNVDLNMVYTVAAYHDLGMKIAREGHALHSKNLLLKDNNLKKWFNNEDINIMADGVEDHSTSSNHKARNIYGEIVSDADKDLNVDIGLMRGWNFTLKNNPSLDFDGHFKNLCDVMEKRFVKNEKGKRLVKFYFNIKAQNEYVDRMEYFALHQNELKEKIIALLAEQEKQNH